MTLEQWKLSGKHFTYKEKYTIFYQESVVAKTVLLLLHGFPTASWDWHKLWTPLTENFHIIAPDFIGYGFSDKPKQYFYSVKDQADLVETLLAKKNIKNCHVLSHDFGDTVLQELLARQLERNENEEKEKGIEYTSVCLLNGGLFPETHQPRPIQKALISPFGIFLTPFLNKKKLRNNFLEIFGKNTPPTHQEIDEFYSLMSRQGGKYIFHKLIRYMAERKQNRERWVGALQNYKKPLLLINGNFDPISGKHMSDRFKTLVPNGTVVDLDGIGHYPQTEAPQLVLKNLLAFLKRDF